MADPLVIAIVGAESTGKTELAQALARELSARGHKATWVSETLRDWCLAQGRTPRRDEQRGIAERHSLRIAEAATAHDLVVADTTALMTAVYSHIVFGDDSLDTWAAQLHRRCSLTLLTAIDLPWVADDGQRDGPQVRDPVDRRLRALLARHGIGWSVVTGQGPRRLQAAMQAVAPLWAPTPAAGRPADGRRGWRHGHWACEGCDDPACEAAALKRRGTSTG